MSVRDALAGAPSWHPAQPQTPASFFSAATLADLPVQPRAWHVRDIIPAGTVTMLGGDAGVGKSIVALQLAVATAAGVAWLGCETAGGGVLYLSAEDGRDELHRRIADVCAAE
jgi:RecA-family ATPase